MTERDCWFIIAEAYLTPHSNRTTTQKRLTASGLCHAYDCMCPDDKQSCSNRMLPAMETMGYEPTDHYLAPLTSDNESWRGMTALLLATLSSAERKEFFTVDPPA